MPDLLTGLFILTTSLFASLTAVYVVGWFVRFSAPGVEAAAGPVSARNGRATTLGNTDSLKTGSDGATLREIFNVSPFLIWRQSPDGTLTWANRAYKAMAAKVDPEYGDNDEVLPVLFAPCPHGQKGSGRRTLRLSDQPGPLWFELYSYTLENGQDVHFALNANPAVQAEEALRTFVQTLTKTFAHLPIGLAIFDRNRRLAVFNPALSDLTALEPDWLTARPTLPAFLDRLRENRHLPEPKDYKSWRDRISALEKAAEDGTYEEHWPLPSGQTYKVTGRPHPEGAVAFLFEDITSSITLRRHLRSELELGQSVIDSLNDAIAVFSTSGDLVLSNDAFVEIWGTDPREIPAGMTVEESIALWQDACQPNPIWKDLKIYCGNPQGRVKSQSRVTLKTGKTLLLRFEPVARGAILCRFSLDERTVASRTPNPGTMSLSA